MLPSESLWLRAKLEIDFPSDVEHLYDLCINEVGFPVGYYHPEILTNLFAISPNREIVDELRLPYIYLSAYYFCLDSIVDKDIVKSENAVYLTHLLTGSIHQFTRYFDQNYPDKANLLKSLLHEYISKNAAAVLSELEFRRNPFKTLELEEFESIVGRSNSFLLLLDLLSHALDAPVAPVTRTLIDRFLYFMQLGDDLGDWRLDFHNKRWTSFLRGCFSELGRIPNEAELERLVYLNGSYEQRAIRILKGFNEIIRNLAEQHYDSDKNFLTFVVAQRDRLYTVLRDFVEVKQSCISWNES
ncbi:MAG: hypothetical protein ABL999_03695 [Pyrinomonadaceae bacterium]